MRVFVTGASGFIGSAVVRALIDDGYRVRALCEPGRDDDNLDGLAVERIVGDIRDPATLDDAVEDVSIVFHLAAIYRFWAADPDLFYDVNVGGTMNVIRAAERGAAIRRRRRGGAGGRRDRRPRGGGPGAQPQGRDARLRRRRRQDQFCGLGQRGA